MENTIKEIKQLTINRIKKAVENETKTITAMDMFYLAKVVCMFEGEKYEEKQETESTELEL